MTLPIFTIKPKEVSTPRLEALVKFPGKVIGTTGIEVTKENGTYTFETDWTDFGSISAIPTSPTSYILTFDTATGVYVLVPSHLLGGAASGIADAPTDGTLYARQNAAWVPVPPAGSDTSVTRIITASTDVTVAVGDGVIAFNQTVGTSVNVLLPSVTSRNGLILSVEDIKGTAAAHPITITPNGTEKIDGLSSIQLANAYGFFTLRPYTATGWKIINSA